MGQKTNPISLRININRNFDSSWYQDQPLAYANLLQQDIKIRNYVKSLFLFIGVHTGRINLQFFPKKLVLHYFFHDTNLSLINSAKSSSLAKPGETKTQKKMLLPLGLLEEPFGGQTVWPTNNFSFLTRHKKVFTESSSLVNGGSLVNETGSAKSNLEQFQKHLLVRNFLINSKKGKPFGGQTLSFLQDFIRKQNYLSSKRFVNKGGFANAVGFVDEVRFNKLPSVQLLQAKPIYAFDGLESSTVSTSHLVKPFGSTLKPSADQTFLIDQYKERRTQFIIDNNLKHLESILSQTTSCSTLFVPLKVSSKYKSAQFVCEYIAQKVQQNVSFRQIFKQILQEIQKVDEIQGIRVVCSGRLGGVEMAKVESKKFGQTSLHVFSSKIDFASESAYTLFGLIGVKVWISYKLI